MKSKSNRRLTRNYGLLPAVLIAACLFSPSVFAIPSPDLVINLSASIAQLLGLLSVLFGGFAFSASKKSNGRKRTNQKSSKKLFIVAFGLLAVSASINLLQYTSSIDEKNERLHRNLVRKSVENGQAVGDTNLKTLSFSEQKTHPLGVTTETLAEWLDTDTPLNIFDVREDAEIEGGIIGGAKHIRYPDILANPDLIPEGGNNLLLCYSGNRSSELCQTLAESGRSCNFMVGGYEKWLTESRPIENSGNRKADDLRNLPDYANKTVLLDTPDVHKLVDNENAQFIDVRYPGDFLLDHLPQAHNITMRALNTNDLKNKIDNLPDVPLIAACYDKRSCFYSQLIGLEIDRSGRDYRGRYTVPHEFYQIKGDREHVELWRAANQKVTLASTITTPITGLLNWLTDKGGHYVLGILFLVLLVRFLLLPLTIKSERDQIVQKALKPELDQIKINYAEHPRAMSRSTLKLYRENKIKPVFNLISSIAQLGFLLLFYSVINNAAKAWDQKFLWIETPSLADPTYVLPALVSVLFLCIILMQSNINTTRRKIFLAIGGVAFFALVQSLSAAVNVYFVITMVVLIAQKLLINALSLKFNWDRSRQDTVNIPNDDGLVPLREAHLHESTGKKAARLGELISAGYNVPDGFVFTGAITQRPADNSANNSSEFLSKSEIKRLSILWLKLKAEKVAVRSSGLSEDGADTSFAGVYDSILNVTKSDLVDAVRKVYLSLGSDIATSYNNNVNDETNSLSKLGGVVVQKMVPAEYAGVMFTEHPANAGAILVEVVAGLGEDLVSGTVTPDSYSFGKKSGQSLDDAHCTIDLTPLLALGRELEQRFSHPQDIEWAYANGKFFLLQARDITRSVCDQKSSVGFAERERSRLLTAAYADSFEDVVYAQNELSELLPTPTPLSASFMSKLWSAGGSTDLACQHLGIPYDVHFESAEFFTTVFGRTYINKTEEKTRLGKGQGALAAFKLARNADLIENQFQEDVLPDLLRAAALNSAVDYSRLTLDKMVETLDLQLTQFVRETYVEAEIINISADYYWKTATAKLTAENIDPSEYLNYVPRTVVSEAMSLIGSPDATGEDVVKFVNSFGHRAPLDYELSSPRYIEDPTLISKLMQGHGHNKNSEQLAPLPEKKLLRISVDRVHRFQALKEEAKHYCMFELYQIRKLLLAIDARCEFDGNIFYLSLGEVLTLAKSDQIARSRALITERLQEATLWQAINPPTSLSIVDLEKMDVSTGQVKREITDEELVGKRVAGEGTVTGVVRIINSVDEIEEFKEGEILVARMTDPQWYPFFPLAKGIITEVGGWLSHAAIVAREYNLPAIVGVENACATLQTGDVVDLNSDGSIVQHEERRKPDSKLRQIDADSQQTSNSSDAEESENEAVLIDLDEMRERANQRARNLSTIGNKRDRKAKQLLRNHVRSIVPIEEQYRKVD